MSNGVLFLKCKTQRREQKTNVCDHRVYNERIFIIKNYQLREYRTARYYIITKSYLNL